MLTTIASGNVVDPGSVAKLAEQGGLVGVLMVLGTVCLIGLAKFVVIPCLSQIAAITGNVERTTTINKELSAEFAVHIKELKELRSNGP